MGGKVLPQRKKETDMSNYKTIAITAKITDLGTALSEEHQTVVSAERRLAEAAPDLMLALLDLLRVATVNGVEGASFSAGVAVRNAREAVLKAGGTI